MATHTFSWTQTERVLARLFMFLTVLLLLGTGLALLTSPAWIPVTVVLWLSAAAIAGIAVWGPLPEQ
jgi:hypothetical protein